MRIVILIFCIWPFWAAADCVVLIHGLGRSDFSFVVMQKILQRHGYEVVVQSYPSTEADLFALAEQTLPRAFDACEADTVHIVTHSMGGILVRIWLAQGRSDVPNDQAGLTRPAPQDQRARLGRVVMLAPPNQRSEVVDVFGNMRLFSWLNGPASQQLGTDGVAPVLPQARYPLGMIAGNRSINPLFSALIPGRDDGAVSVAATAMKGMTDHITLPATHSFLMNNPLVLYQVLWFLRQGAFARDVTLMDAVKALTQH